MAETTNEDQPKKPGRPAKVEVIALRKIGVEVDEAHPDGMAQPGERLKLNKEDAQKLQAAKAVEVVI